MPEPEPEPTMPEPTPAQLDPTAEAALGAHGRIDKRTCPQADGRGYAGTSAECGADVDIRRAYGHAWPAGAGTDGPFSACCAFGAGTRADRAAQ